MRKIAPKFNKDDICEIGINSELTKEEIEFRAMILAKIYLKHPYDDKKLKEKSLQNK